MWPSCCPVTRTLPRPTSSISGAAGIHRRALALVGGTAISSRTRGTANAYEVVHLEGAMDSGGRISVQLREASSTGWSERRTTHFGYSSDGVTGALESS